MRTIPRREGGPHREAHTAQLDRKAGALQTPALPSGQAGLILLRSQGTWKKGGLEKTVLS